MKLVLRRKFAPALKIIDHWLAYQRWLKHIPGMSVGIVYKDKTIFAKGYGYADLVKKKPATPETCYRIASISKTFTATAIMQLAEQGKVRLDDPVSVYLPWFSSSRDKNLNHITIRQLLTHTSGIERDGNTAHWGEAKFPSLDKIKKQVREGISVFSRLERWKYSNIGYAVVGEIIAAVSKMPYEQYIGDCILRPLQMSHTAVDFNAEIKKKLAIGYRREIPGLARQAFANRTTGALAPATGFCSSARDLCQYLSAQFLNSGRLLSKESKREMQRIQFVDNEEKDWCGLGFQTWKMNNIRLYGHAGGFQGYTTKIGMDPKNEIGIVVLTNAIDVEAELTNGMYHTVDYFLKNFETFKPVKKKISLKRYEGLFYSIWGDIEVVEIHGSLNFLYPESEKPMETLARLRYVTPTSFVMTSARGTDWIGEPMRFVFSKRGRIIKMYHGSIPCVPFRYFKVS